MRNPNSLSIGILYFDTPLNQFNTTINSTITAVKNAKRMGLLQKCTIYIINNSATEKLLTREIEIKLANEGITPKFIKNEENIGFARAHNIAISESDDNFHLILNPDVELEAFAIAEGLKFLRANVDCSIVGPKGEDREGKNLYLAKAYPTLLSLLLRGLRGKTNLFAGFLSDYECHQLYEKQKPEKILLTSGCFMLCRLQHLKNIEGFDERFFLYFEDFDLSLRIQSEGKVYWLPSMLIFHSGGHTITKGLFHIFLFIKAALRFFRSHGWKLI